MRQAGKSFKFSLWQESPLSSLLIRTSAKRTKRIAIYTGFAECLHDRFLQLQTSSEILPLKMGDEGANPVCEQIVDSQRWEAITSHLSPLMD